MFLSRILLQHFRSYPQADFTFNEGVTCIVGPNTAGKTNLLEAISLLAIGKGFRAEKETELIQFGQEVARVKGQLLSGEGEKDKGDKEKIRLEVVVAQGETAGGRSYLKKYLVNDVPKRRVDFVGQLQSLLFIPADLAVIIGSPSYRRHFFDEVLEVVDREYRQALSSYERALRQRNALLELVRETGQRNQAQFSYWDDLLITNGQIITKKREAFIAFMNKEEKTLLPFRAVYDHSTISEERLLQYKGAEVGSGVTLVGPHRDDFQVLLTVRKEERDARTYGSRGQQRLVVLQLKLLQLAFMKQMGSQPILLLDDIFSELDEAHIQLVMDIMKGQQTILTTTHKEFLSTKMLRDASMIELEK